MRRRQVFLSACTALVLALFSARAHAGPEYVRVRDLAAGHGLKYQDLSSGSIHACKLMGKGHSIFFYAGMSHVLVDSTSRTLTAPVEWNGTAIMAPSQAAEVVARALGERVYRPKGRPAQRRRPFKVVIDPGHGGKDPGASGTGGLQEKVVNLDVARKLAAYLRKEGVTVIMTRSRDVALSLDERVNIANRARPDLFISVHANAEASRRRRGAMTLYPDDGPRDGRADLHGRARRVARGRSFSLKPLGAGGTVGKAAKLAVTYAAFEVYRTRSIRAAGIIQTSLAPVTGTIPRENGVIEDNYRGLRVLRNTHAPAVLVEVDFLSNRQSERKLKRSSYRSEIARALGQAVVKFRMKMEEE